jgi:general secretion pathway protein A
MVISDFTHDIRLIWMAEPPVNSMDLFLFIAQELGMKSPSTERVFVLRDIKDALININSAGSKCLLIIDESHLMADDVLDGIRILNNLEVGASKLIQILLLGQEELMKKINRPELEAFRQRIATLEMLGKMNADRIRKYVSYRIRVAGGSPSLLADTGWEALVLAFGSGSTPRVINSLCDRALNTAFEREKKIVDVDDVYEAAQVAGLQKDIFFYKIALKKQDKEKQVLDNTATVTINEPEEHNKPVHSFIRKSDDVTDQIKKNRQPETPGPEKSGRDSVVSIFIKDKKNKKVAIALLSLSIAALILSIFFYCDRSGSTDTLTCIQELISF